jgi:hypothetical protein
MLRAAAFIFVLLAGSCYADLSNCISCQFFVGTVIQSLPPNSNVALIAARIDTLCDALPALFKTQCHAFVSQNRDAVISFLSNGRSAEYVCKALKVCPATATEHEVIKSNQIVSADFKPADAACEFCTYVMVQVQHSLNDNFTVSNIANTLNIVCQHLPFGQQDCFHFMQSYFPLLIKYLSAHDTAGQVCTLLGQCTNSTMERISRDRSIVREYVASHPLELSAQSSSGCQLCQWVVSAGEAWLSDGHNEAEISNFLQQVCDFFNQYAAQCQQLVAVYTPKAIEMLIENYTPPYICGQLGGCSP